MMNTTGPALIHHYCEADIHIAKACKFSVEKHPNTVELANIIERMREREGD